MAHHPSLYPLRPALQVALHSVLKESQPEVYVRRYTQESSPTPQFKSINSLALSFLYSPTLTSIRDSENSTPQSLKDSVKVFQTKLLVF